MSSPSADSNDRRAPEIAARSRVDDSSDDRVVGSVAVGAPEVATASSRVDDSTDGPVVGEVAGAPERITRASDLLTRDEIRSLTRTSNAVGSAAVAWSWLVIAGCFAASALVPHPAVWVAAVIVLGGRQLALAVLMHEAAHGTLFRTRWLNERAADWLCARPVWSDVARYRRHHLQHHAHTGTERDPDLGLALARPMSPRSLRRKIVRDLAGATGAKRVIGLLLIDAEVLTFDVGGGPRRAVPRPWPRHALALARNLWRPLAANAVIVAVLAAAGHPMLYLLWVAAYLTTFSLFVRVRSLAEHACMARGPEPLRNTRSTRANALARITVAPLHVNLHLEHHLLPTVPWFRLPALERLLVERGALPASSRAANYRAVLRAVTAR